MRLLLPGLIAIRAAAAEGPATNAPAPQLSVEPKEVRLKPGQQWVPLTYTLNNGPGARFAVENRFAHFESDPAGWRSALIGPYPMAVEMPQNSSSTIKDNAYIPIEILQEALRAGALTNGRLVLAQGFTFKPNPAGITNLTARITFVLDYPATDVSETNFNTEWHEVTALKQFTDDTQRMVRLRTMLGYADKSYGALTNELGFQPAGGAKVPLSVNSFDGFPCFMGGPRPHMAIPWNVVEAQEGIQFLFVVYPHELAHYFLMTRFPDPPKWFVEGPASYFGNKVALALGYRESAAHDRKKILGFAAEYKAKGCTYCFEPSWPEDQGRNDNPNDVHSYGFGYAYEICMELDELCGEGFFPKVFRHMEAAKLDFSRARDENEKNRLLVEAMQSQTKKDLRAYFAKKGFKG